MKAFFKTSVILASGFSMLVLSIPALADSVSETVRAGTTTRIYIFSVFDSTNCRVAIFPRLKTKEFKNGKIVGRQGSFVPNSGRCNGQRIRGIDALYTPKPGFRGVDKFRFCYKYDKYNGAPMPPSSHCVRATITVK